MAAERTVTLKIKRQEAPDKPSRWEEFSLPYRPGMNGAATPM